MGPKVKILLYASYVAAAVAASLYVRFPSDTIRDYTIRQAQRLLPGLEVAVADVRPALPAAVRFRGVEADFRTSRVLELEQIRVAPQWGAILRLTPAVTVKTTIGGGRIRGEIRPSGNDAPMRFAFQTEFDRIQLAELSMLTELLGRRMSGVVSGTASNADDSSVQGIQLRIRVDDAAVALRQPLLQRDQVSFRQIEAEAAIRNAEVQLTSCTFRGPEFDGEISGRIDLRRDFGNSGIELRGTVRPHTVFMAELKKIVPAQLMAGLGAGGEFPFRLAGTVNNPRYSFR